MKKSNILSIKLNKGAMFGLDARIALVVIAVLGLMAYPMANSVIEKSKAKAIIASSKAITVAIASYISDVNSIPLTIDNLFSTAPTKSNQASLWNGPYLQGEKTTALMPSFSWTLENDDCSSTTTSSRYCTYRISYIYCQQPKEVYSELLKHYNNASQVLTYNPTGKCITINYGYSDNSSTKNYVSFKVKEKP